ncbi:hypothetical protein AB0G86_33305 [Streptomyces scabiei]|uniref:hypothetical protein n=1 Tax=Streptomyces scabiei TaxID=1930 RepID=UPI0033F312C5
MAWATREEFQAEMDEFDALRLKKEEWAAIDDKLTDLHRRQHSGDDTELTRVRIERLEALQSALCGDPAALVRPPARPMRG